MEEMLKDARWFQIAFLSGLLLAGWLGRGFQVAGLQIALVFGAGLATQAYFLKRLKLEGVGYLSAVVTCLGTCLLLRSDRWWVLPLAAIIGNGGKFVLRSGDRHLFNPANLGVVTALWMGHAWVSPAQWGHETMIAAWIAVMGMTVVRRAGRWDVSLAFLGCWLALVFFRVEHLGQRTAVFWHQLHNGSLLLFTFFMISDPKTIPDSRLGRLWTACTVAMLAFGWQYALFRQNGLFYALFLVTPLTALWDRWRPAQRHAWVPEKDTGGHHHESTRLRPIPA